MLFVLRKSVLRLKKNDETKGYVTIIIIIIIIIIISCCCNRNNNCL